MAVTREDGPTISEPGAILQEQVLALAAAERAISAGLDRQATIVASAHPQLQALLSAVGGRSEAHAASLEAWLREAGVNGPVPRSPVAALLDAAISSRTLATTLHGDSAAFAFAAAGYSVLAELALRLYDPALRELAPRHLAAHASAIRQLLALAPFAVVEELNGRGVGCRCICPMCSIGACGCSAAGSGWIEEAWSQATPPIDDEPGFLVTPPRQDSQLAEHGVQGGNRLLSVDGRAVSTFRDVQAAIRRHALGDQVALRLRRGPYEEYEVRVRHVYDYEPAPG